MSRAVKLRDECYSASPRTDDKTILDVWLEESQNSAIKVLPTDIVDSYWKDHFGGACPYRKPNRQSLQSSQQNSRQNVGLPQNKKNVFFGRFVKEVVARTTRVSEEEQIAEQQLRERLANVIRRPKPSDPDSMSPALLGRQELKRHQLNLQETEPLERGYPDLQTHFREVGDELTPVVENTVVPNQNASQVLRNFASCEDSLSFAEKAERAPIVEVTESFDNGTTVGNTISSAQNEPMSVSKIESVSVPEEQLNEEANNVPLAVPVANVADAEPVSSVVRAEIVRVAGVRRPGGRPRDGRVLVESGKGAASGTITMTAVSPAPVHSEEARPDRSPSRGSPRGHKSKGLVSVLEGRSGGRRTSAKKSRPKKPATPAVEGIAEQSKEAHGFIPLPVLPLGDLPRGGDEQATRPDGKLPSAAVTSRTGLASDQAGLSRRPLPRSRPASAGIVRARMTKPFSDEPTRRQPSPPPREPLSSLGSKPTKIAVSTGADAPPAVTATAETIAQSEARPHPHPHPYPHPHPHPHTHTHSHPPP